MALRIGVDESGKGDYFGYLVIAGVLLDNKDEKKLRDLGVKDSKRLSDLSVLKISTELRKLCTYDIVEISPLRYNDLYKKFRNLNKLLAWGHARVIENLLAKHQADLVIVDKFADEKVLAKALLPHGKKAVIEQRVRGESDLAVAAASILARAEFLKTLKKLSTQFDCKLPKGATHVEEAARQLIAKHTEKILPQVAKVHFKTTKQILG